MTNRPLTGIRALELVGIGPGPYAGQLLADLGAEVVAIDRPAPRPPLVTDRGKRSVILNLRREGAAEAVLSLCETADLLIEGFRPGVAERLGLGPDVVRARNPALVYGRMTGWGQTGPWAHTAGHDINYVALTGALHAMGEAGRPPTPPLNLVGDYGGGSLFMVRGLLAGLLRAKTTGEGSVVDAAIVDGVASLMGVVPSLAALGMWSAERQDNMIDGGAPYYRCYACKDGGYMAAGPIEPQFFAQMLAILGIDPSEYGGQNDKDAWPRQHALLEARFGERTRDEWAATCGGTAACVPPVLTWREARAHPQGAARNLYPDAQGRVQPKVAPVLGEHAAPVPPLPERGAHTEDVLSGIGLDAQAISRLSNA